MYVIVRMFVKINYCKTDTSKRWSFMQKKCQKCELKKKETKKEKTMKMAKQKIN